MSKNEKRDSAVGGAVISGSSALIGLSIIFGSAALSPVAMVGTAFTVAACSAVCLYSIGVAIEAEKSLDSDRTEKQSDDRRGPPPPLL